MTRIDTSSQLMARVARFALATLLLTTVHHVYGAFVYDTPWRLHVGFVAGAAAAAIVAAFHVARRTQGTRNTIAFWFFAIVTLSLPVVLIGLVEGGYNHVLKNALYFGGGSPDLLNWLFPAPAYEMPDDVFFEMTGIMQMVVGSVTGWFLHRLLRLRLNDSEKRRRAADANVLSA